STASPLEQRSAPRHSRTTRQHRDTLWATNCPPPSLPIIGHIRAMCGPPCKLLSRAMTCVPEISVAVVPALALHRSSQHPWLDLSLYSTGGFLTSFRETITARSWLV
ncbi:hypothetical protein J6590_068442, partial [Homalodisca vitripennis]